MMPVSPLLPKLVGARVKRREDPRLIQGRGTYVDDIKIPGMCHLAFKRNDIAHGDPGAEATYRDIATYVAVVRAFCPRADRVLSRTIARQLGGSRPW